MNYYLEIIAMIGLFSILAMSLNVISGLTGLLHLGQAGFFAIGAYGAAAYTNYWWSEGLGSFNYVMALLFVIVLAIIFALIVGVPCLRLRGDYLAIATLGFGEIIRLCLENFEFIGGANGYRIDRELRFVNWWIIWIAVVLIWLIFIFIKRSSIGRAFLAIRQG